MHQPQRVENAKILIANTPMDTDKIKVFGSRVKVDNVSQIAELELAEKEKMKAKAKELQRMEQEQQRFVCVLTGRICILMNDKRPRCFCLFIL